MPEPCETVTVTLELGTLSWLDRVADLAGTTRDQVIGVVVAQHVLASSPPVEPVPDSPPAGDTPPGA